MFAEQFTVGGAVREEWPDEKPLFYRLSCIDKEPGGWTLDESVVLARELSKLGVDVIDCSSSGLGQRDTPVLTPRKQGFQVPFAERIRLETDLATMTVGLIQDPEYAESVLQEGRADLVAIAARRYSIRNGRYTPALHFWAMKPMNVFGNPVSAGGWTNAPTPLPQQQLKQSKNHFDSLIDTTLGSKMFKLLRLKYVFEMWFSKTHIEFWDVRRSDNEPNFQGNPLLVGGSTASRV